MPIGVAKNLMPNRQLVNEEVCFSMDDQRKKAPSADQTVEL